MKNTQSLKDRLVYSAVAGVVWGLVAMGINNMTGVFAFESTFTHNLVSFIFGGVVFSIVSGGILYFAGSVLPFKGYLPKALMVTTFVWLLLRGGGVLLSQMDSHRYHVVTPESIQGLGLAVLLGLFLGLFWTLGSRGLQGSKA
ncbi:MAG: hypothetical protein IME99_00855 [Proteobacteria bacterium]|nr:hypothetical protein [Pseudomonadota bacterium]